MKSDYFVEFPYHQESLKEQERFKFLLAKYKQNRLALQHLKAEKIREIDSLIAILDLLETEMKEFKKLMPTKPEAEAAERRRRTW